MINRNNSISGVTINGTFSGDGSGLTGITGATGPSGTSGTSGTSGANGSSGTSGAAGSSGTSGAAGSSGTSGSAGSSGTSGTRGTSGTSGAAGSSGTSGINGVNQRIQFRDNYNTISGTISSVDSATGKMITTNAATYFTPQSTGDVLISYNFGIAATDEGVYELRYGTGTAPTNGDAATGTSTFIRTQSDAGGTTFKDAINLTGVVTGLSTSVQYWFAVCVKGLSGTLPTVAYSSVNASVIELAGAIGATGPASGSSGTSGANGATGPSGTSGTSGANGSSGTSGTSGISGVNAGSFGITIDGGGSAITTGVKGYLQVPYSGTITSWTLLSDISGSATIDIWKTTYSSALPTVVNTITASAKPTLTSAVKNTSSTLTGWTTSVTAGDVIGFNVDSSSTLTRLNITINITKS